MSDLVVKPAGEPLLLKRFLLADLLDLPTFQELVKSFSDLYKVGIKVFDERGTRLADVKVGNGDFCGYVFSTAQGRSLCSKTVARVKAGPLDFSEGGRPLETRDSSTQSMVALPCFTGLRYLMMPILWEGDELGRIVFGPFVPEELDGLPASLTQVAPELDPRNALSLMARIRRAPEGTVAKVMAHFAQIVDALVAAGQKSFFASVMHVESSLEANRELESKNRRLEDLNQKLQELDKLKSSFLATVSHELRTPLTSIIGYSEMLAEGMTGPLNQEQSEYAHTIMEKGEALLKLITSILDLSQIEAGKVRLNFKPVDMARVLQESVSSVKPQAGKRHIQLALSVPDGEGLLVTADHDKLEQVVVNLLANAVKFTPPHGKIEVSLSGLSHQPELDAEGYRVDVQDTGVGIPAAEFGKIFQSFYQVDGSSTREFGGAGLGLAIVKSFVDGHGGKVLLTSIPGQGSCFSVVLPKTPPPQNGITPPLMVEDRFT